MITKVSPNFTIDKLENASYQDLIDIFEDALRNRLLEPVNYLLNIPNGDFAAMALLAGYFESIEIYQSGEDSKNKSELFFTNGFLKVFSGLEISPEISKKIAKSIYSQVRCGFMHIGTPRDRVFLSRVRKEAILVTWPKKDGVFDQTKDVESIVINPQRFYECICIHFDSLINTLRNQLDLVLTESFKNSMNMIWGAGDSERLIGMTEADFFLSI